MNFFSVFSLIIHYFHEKFPRIPSSLLLKTCSVFKIILPLLSLPRSLPSTFYFISSSVPSYFLFAFMLKIFLYFFFSLSPRLRTHFCAQTTLPTQSTHPISSALHLLYATPETLQNSADGKASCIAWDGWLGVVGKNERETFERSEKRDRMRKRWSKDGRKENCRNRVIALVRSFLRLVTGHFSYYL